MSKSKSNNFEVDTNSLILWSMVNIRFWVQPLVQPTNAFVFRMMPR